MKLSQQKYRFIQYGMIVLGICGMAYSLQQMSEKLLWERLPEYLFLSFYFTVLGLVLTFVKTSNKDVCFKYILLTMASGLGLGLSFPPYGIIPFAFLCFIPILYLDKKRQEGSISGRQFFIFLFNAFVLWNIVATYWVANSALAAGIVAIVLNSLLMTLPIILANWLYRTVTIKEYYGLIWTACWLLFEFIHLRWDISWPWLTLGNAMSSAPLLAQWYEFTGVLGGSAWFLGGNVLLFKLFYINIIRRRKLAITQLIPVALWLFIPMIGSFWIYSQSEYSSNSGKISVINANFEPHYEKFSANANDKFKVFDGLIDEALKEQPNLILLPETSFDRVYIHDLDNQSAVKFLRDKVEQSRENTAILTGITALKIFGQTEVLPDRSSIRTSTDRLGEDYHWEVYNSALMVQPDEIDLYHKRKLVPGAEIFPYRNLLFFFKPIVDGLGGSIYGYGRPQSKDVFTFQNINIGPVICYESVYGDFCRKYVLQGSNVLGVVTNDGWWGDTEGYKQHYDYAKLRAIELRRSVVRSANLGRCGFIDPNGLEMQAPNDYDEQAVLTQIVPLNSELTFYAKWGDFLGRFSLFLLIFIVLKAIVEKLKSLGRPI
ncbi:apolipoprotein N-acyltransferase [Membranihabitans marinus]|uniref:apolipoprotein N-acyltransferase n=1 Tax=Membranihabitans marinus TaxID=1227546 RepID=UPI001F012399|nr:apolipoprotein N-acyltransferase [Membranihabitans marinus]